MVRAHAATGCVQSDSIKGLAQSIAKPAYHRLLIAEPALRRAVPTLIIAFLITICLGAFVQVVDQNRQKRAAMKRDLAALADVLAERIDRVASVRQNRNVPFERLQLLLPSRILDVVSAALPVSSAAQLQGVTDIILPNGSSALAIAHIVRALPGQVIIIQERVDSLWQSDAALSV